MSRAALGVFCVISVERFGNRLYLNDLKHPVASGGAGEFLACNESLGEQHIAIRPVLAPDFLRGMGPILFHDYDAEGRAFADGFQDIGRGQHVTARRLVAADREAVCDWDARRREDRLGEVLLHGERGRPRIAGLSRHTH